MRCIVVLGLLSAVMLPGCSGRKPGSFADGRTVERTNGGPVTGVSEKDPEMNAAIAKARSTLGTFAAELDHPHAGAQYTVKVKFPTDHQSAEHIWLDRVKLKATTVTGVLTDEPDDIARYHKGQTVTASRADITDWAVFEASGEMRGGYTEEIVLRRSGAKGR